MRAAISFFLLLICACGPDPKAKEVEAAVRMYNVGLMQTYNDVDLNYMKHFATEKEMNKLFAIILALKTTNSKMIAIQDSFSVKKVVIEGKTATLSSEEQWTYWWEDINTKAVTKGKNTQKYKILYKLKKVGERWMIDELVHG